MSKVHWPAGRRVFVARLIIRSAARFVPAGRREEWRQTWEGDLFELAANRGSRDPTVLAFASGILTAVLSELIAEWGPGALAGDTARAWRRLRTSPLDAAIAVVIMTIGVSGSTSIFAVLNSTLVRVPPHIADANRLVQIGRLNTNDDFDNFSYPNYADIRDQHTVFSGVAAYGRLTRLVRMASETIALPIDAVTEDFFDVLGTAPTIGRAFSPSDDAARAPVAVISDTLWRRHFRASADAVGRTLLLEGVPFAIVGVAPPGFIGPDVVGAKPEAWIPLLSYETRLASPSRLSNRGYSWLRVVARLAPGVSVDQARAAMQLLHTRLARQHADTIGTNIGVVRGVGLRPDERLTGERLSKLLMSTVATVLVMAGANLAGLFVARCARRQRDLTVCAALGASSARLTRELLAEQILVAVAGAIVAWTLAWWSAGAVQSLLPYTLAVTSTPDWRVFVFAVVTAVVASLAFGAQPAGRTARVDVARGLREGSAGAGGFVMPSRSIVAAQLALSFALLIAAGLLVKSVAQARVADPGFDVDSVAAVRLNFELVRRRSEAEATRTAQQLLETVEQQTGVVRAAFASHPPLAMPQRTRSIAALSGDFTEQPPSAAVNAISPGYLATLKLTLLQGRDFRDADADPRAARTVLISESAARRLWPGANAVGQRLDVGGRAEVVGVVSDVKLRSLNDRNLASVYVPIARDRPADLTMLVRTTLDPGAVSAQVADVVRTSAPDVVITAAAPLRDLVGRTYGETRLLATLLVVFASLAALLAAAGLYVVLASWVAERRRELGIRVVLGATRGDLRLLVVRRAAPPALAGLMAGGCLAVAASRSLAGLLFGVSPLDPLTYLSAAVLLLTITLAAGCVPARRAVCSDPIVILKGV